MENSDVIIEQLAGMLPPITLEEMSAIRLMNRTDRKYVTSLPVLLRLLEKVRGSYYSQQTGGQRISPYSTIYWDDAARSMYHNHQAGHLPRQKVRVRTYVGSGKSFLEIKNKDNHGKTHKCRTSVPSPQAVIADGAGEDYLKEKTGLDFSVIKPTLANRFNRITLVNKAKTERLTIDFNLCFQNWETKEEKSIPEIVIIELKRDGRAYSPILPILRELRIMPSGFSKYCIGATLTLDGLRVNRFKKRIIKIRRVLERSKNSIEQLSE